ncbi:hypothetical protein [uncultured Clostridium sp.]|uniref:hypothetical protein n=1 Tax=uncultured Clostridium sp. TaxID=59620 RepID=UPI0025DBA745|nr:hypothetical protein [uncultured Clostridium sp.]
MKKANKNRIIGVSLAAMAAIGGSLMLKNKWKQAKNQGEIEAGKFVTGRIRKMGVLYLNNVKIEMCNEAKTPDNIVSYQEGNIEIKDADKNDDNKISWVEINDDDKKLLICNKNLIKGISWNELNDQNLTYGKIIKLGGRKYLLRLLTGATTESGEDFSEWDKYILNVNGLEELPVSTDEDKNNTVKEESENIELGESNMLWNWRACCSFTQSEYGKNNKFCIIRGLYSTTYNNYCDKDITYETVGYRPVLELME